MKTLVVPAGRTPEVAFVLFFLAQDSMDPLNKDLVPGCVQ